jgi:primosomal protein N' (replication factor Y) (superfamily II helicase)
VVFVQVAVDVPVDKQFDYSAPDAGIEDIGRRVIVPFGRKRVLGVIVAVGRPATPTAQIKSVEAILRDDSRLPPDVLALLEFAADYYRHPIGQVVFAALPPALRRGRALTLHVEQHFRLTSQGREAKLPARAQRLRRTVETLRERGVQSAPELAAAGATAALLRDLIARGWIALTLEPERIYKKACTHLQLTAEQQEALDRIAPHLTEYGVWLLHGITGSGKTEVYLQLVERVLARGGQAMVLVPEINLTPQLEARFRARFPQVEQVSLHSNLAEVERAQRWLKASAGVARVVLGTRLAVFTPMPRLALVVVDEEHDASFKQNDGLRYSARDLAIYRAKARGAPVVLGSATPSLESYHHAQRGRYRMLTMSQRAHAQARLPAIRLVDLRVNNAEHGLTDPLTRALAGRLAAGEQSLVFINRRGYAPVLYCPHCAWTSGCPRCSVKLVFHRKDQRLWCHHCGHSEPPPRHCPSCGNADLQPLGEGTQRVEDALQRHFPPARILRIDRDAVRGRDAWHQVAQRVGSGEADILVGTQLLAKGHDFPRITLVGMLNVDAALVSPDFRATERLFSLMLQVAGRAGRGELPGEVLIQTTFPTHPLFDWVLRQDYAAFARALLIERKTTGFPPFVHHALLRIESANEEAAQEFARAAAAGARALNSGNITIYDAVPAPLARLAGRTRMQVLAESPSRTKLQEFLQTWQRELTAKNARHVRWALDVDPQEL